MTTNTTPQDLSRTRTSLQDGDRVTVRFDPPLIDAEIGPVTDARGAVRRIAGCLFLICETHRTAWRMPLCLDLDQKRLADISLVETAAEVVARKAAAARGDIVFSAAPRTPQELEAQLSDLADMIAVTPGATRPGSRRDQLSRQFDDIADLVSLAKTKRHYLLTRARIGTDFHPWTRRDDRIYRNKTVRPLPADFELDISRRTDRAARLEQAVAIFGEAEREVRRVAASLRKTGYSVRRPHPNAQELLVQVAEGRAKADLVVAATPNGLWQVTPGPADNKTRALARARVLRAGHLRRLARHIDEMRAQ